jgi:hypothetical protein
MEAGPSAAFTEARFPAHAEKTAARPMLRRGLDIRTFLL